MMKQFPFVQPLCHTTKFKRVPHGKINIRVVFLNITRSTISLQVCHSSLHELKVLEQVKTGSIVNYVLDREIN